MRKRSHRFDARGFRFKHLVALKEVGRSNQGDRMYECQCDCGNRTIQKISNLTQGYVKSCGCLGIKYKKEERNLRYFYRHYQATAKKRNLIFELDYNTFVEFTSKNCYYCNGAPMERTWYNKTFAANGIDRVNSDVGYVIENCVTSCFICNRAKSDMKQQVFIDWINRLKSGTEMKEKSDETK